MLGVRADAVRDEIALHFATADVHNVEARTIRRRREIGDGDAIVRGNPHRVPIERRDGTLEQLRADVAGYFRCGLRHHRRGRNRLHGSRNGHRKRRGCDAHANPYLVTPQRDRMPIPLESICAVRHLPHSPMRLPEGHK